VFPSLRSVFPTLFAGAVAALVSLTCLSSPASAGQIFVQQSGASPAGGDPNVITNDAAFVIGIAGSATLQNPLLVVIGAYGGVGTPTLSYSGCATPSACAVATLGTYGLTATTATFTAASSGTAFSQLGLNGGGSESFVNWAAGEAAIGMPAPSSFTLYAFAVNVSLTSGSPITVGLSGVANGTYILAYSCDAGTGSSSGCSSNGKIAQTVFTNTGLDAPGVPAPEPASLALLGAALAGFGVVTRRRRGADRR
jgi:hypothetical protein